MSRRRADAAPGPPWAENMRMRAEAEALVAAGADDEAVEERAEHLELDGRRLLAFVREARRRASS